MIRALFLLISSLALLAGSLRAQSDSLWVQTFTFDSIVTRAGIFEFPEEDCWEKILMFHTLKCDSLTPHDQYPCGEWDYTTHTFVSRFTGVFDVNERGELVERMEKYEIARFITPYGKRLDLGINGFTWVYEVSDYAPLLNGKLFLEAGNGQELIDLRFLFIKGKPAREVISVEKLWPMKSYLYKDLSDDKELQAFKITLNPAAAGYKIRSVISGHGHFGHENCCEWMNKEHRLLIDGQQRFAWNVWTDCGLNPVFPQGGTWQFDRAGWCPGSFVDLYEHELTPFVKPGALCSIDYSIQPYDSLSGEAGGDYLQSHQLISYGPANYKRDAEILDILRPSDQGIYKRMNPVTGSPKILIRNRGSETLSSLQIEYGMENGPKSLFEWKGSLAFMQRTEVELPVIDLANSAVNDRFSVELSKPNGKKDQYQNNNRMMSQPAPAVIFPSSIILYLKTQEFGRGADISMEITNLKGDTIYFRNDFADSTEYHEEIELKPGAYRFKIADKNQDGMIRHWWLRNEDPEKIGTDGRIWILDDQKEPIHKFFFDFADYLQLEFYVKEP